jgi:hypothetical protein
VKNEDLLKNNWCVVPTILQSEVFRQRGATVAFCSQKCPQAFFRQRGVPVALTAKREAEDSTERTASASS